MMKQTLALWFGILGFSQGGLGHCMKNQSALSCNYMLTSYIARRLERPDIRW